MNGCSTRLTLPAPVLVNSTPSVAAGGPGDQLPASLQLSDAAAPVHSTPAAGGASVPMLNLLAAPALPMMTSPPWVQTIIGSMGFTASLGAATWPALAMKEGSPVRA
ncbi:MAG: hypothetical protein AW08_03312 [Candidatus Accumulibacter adjunctus]|uniref:Uncharacterized protein n=1 Tax=Candidatus Accumulibacter adjunctus TaxID=1454001 RepID=A0A011PG64_9PROT|nr:MAG: hypothetical protein AW08_03312 [Candidatus Accumulibacter adjunctus]